MERVKIVAISYINTTPFVYGIKHANYNLCVDLLLNTPSECVSKIEKHECDIAIVPVASLIWLNDIEVITNYSISTSGNVRTVELLSNTPISEITDIYLDSESRTSALLVRILANEYWKINPNWHDIKYNETEISPKDGEGYLMIGDKVFDWENKFKYNCDLASAWQAHTSLPFVFAVWVARKDLNAEVIEELNKALCYGTDNISKAVDSLVIADRRATAKDYLTNNIEFSLNADKRKAIEVYISKAMLLKSKEFSSHPL